MNSWQYAASTQDFIVRTTSRSLARLKSLCFDRIMTFCRRYVLHKDCKEIQEFETFKPVKLLAYTIEEYVDVLNYQAMWNVILKRRVRRHHRAEKESRERDINYYLRGAAKNAEESILNLLNALYAAGLDQDALFDAACCKVRANCYEYLSHLTEQDTPVEEDVEELCQS